MRQPATAVNGHQFVTTVTPFYRKRKGSQAEKYPETKSFTRRNSPDSKAFGFEAPTLSKFQVQNLR